MLELQYQIQNLVAYTDDGVPLSYEDVCFQPMSPVNRNCTVLSVLNYFQVKSWIFVIFARISVFYWLMKCQNILSFRGFLYNISSLFLLANQGEFRFGSSRGHLCLSPLYLLFLTRLSTLFHLCSYPIEAVFLVFIDYLIAFRTTWIVLTWV